MPKLQVPYLVQPDATHCQATCLKMMSSYLDRKLGQPVQPRDIFAIKKSINSGAGRPSAGHNAWVNFEWWLQNELGAYIEFKLESTTDAVKAIETIKTSIGNGFPVLVSTNHLNTRGHIILVTGVMAMRGGQLVEPPAGPTGADYRFICHDPYGAFDPALNDPRYGRRRYEGGSSLIGGGETGPGANVLYDLNGIRRVRADRHSTDTFLLLRGVRYLGRRPA